MNLLVNPVSLNQLQTKAIGDNLGNSEESRNNTLLLFFFSGKVIPMPKDILFLLNYFSITNSRERRWTKERKDN